MIAMNAIQNDDSEKKPENMPLRISNLTLAYQDLQVLQNFDLELYPGEILVILGKSGCGKTSLLKTLTGIIPQDSGTMFLNNREISKVSPQNRNIGYVPQTQILFHHLTVKENIIFGLAAKKYPIKEIEMRLKSIAYLTEIQEFLDKYPDKLSLGQQQRVALARALILKPKVLLLDEPLSSIDNNARERLALLIRQINHETNTPIIYVTHNHEEAQLIADRVGIFHNGQIIQDGTYFELKNQMKNFYIAKIMGIPNIWANHGTTGAKNQIQSHQTSDSESFSQIIIPDNVTKTWFYIPLDKINFSSDLQEIGEELEKKPQKKNGEICLIANLIAIERFSTFIHLTMAFKTEKRTEFLKIKKKYSKNMELPQRYTKFLVKVNFQDISFF